MKIEIDETPGVTLVGVALGWMLYNSDPATRELAIWVGMGVIFTFFFAWMTDIALTFWLPQIRGRFGADGGEP